MKKGEMRKVLDRISERVGTDTSPWGEDIRELIGVVEELVSEEAELPPGVDLSLDPDGTRVSIGFSHTLSLGDYESSKPFFSMSTNLRVGDRDDLVGFTKKLYREAAAAYGMVILLGEAHNRALSKGGRVGLVESLLGKVLPESEPGTDDPFGGGLGG